MTDVPERLSETFAALAKAATPGPWHYKHDGRYLHGVPDENPNLAVVLDDIASPDEETAKAVGDFIAFCGTHREAIAEALALREDPRTAKAAPDCPDCLHTNRDSVCTRLWDA